MEPTYLDEDGGMVGVGRSSRMLHMNRGAMKEGGGAEWNKSGLDRHGETDSIETC